ncbi:hypothetical protein BO99DRAFT_88030 [Aspergillus violaceofuscus CBS 115571]|uniref:Uncharacterized protein n=1 Tax=Aspergillus violaceofuscus (strain CBS 115571) TaxID=1450538 RepID=A0A2V5IAZ6_ASPV1|nr:hypothetical protein BO99DRAFT_88030 [Aspergillus violaceofuscus CBS 115571]
MIQRPWSNSFLPVSTCPASSFLLYLYADPLLFPRILDLSPQFDPVHPSSSLEWTGSTWFMFIHLRSSIDHFPPKGTGHEGSTDRGTGDGSNYRRTTHHYAKKVNEPYP